MYSNGALSGGTGIITVVLALFIKVLVVVFILSLLVGLFILAKNYLFNAQDIAALKSSFVPATKAKRTCSACGKALEEDWKVCPYCAEEGK
jgi:hypothetical protein